MEVLKIIVWSLPDRVFVQDLTVTATLSAPGFPEDPQRRAGSVAAG